MTESEMSEHSTQNTQADVTDDSCITELIEIVPLDRSCSDYHTAEFTDVKDVKLEPDDDYNVGGPCFIIKVRFACVYAITIMHSSLLICLCN